MLPQYPLCEQQLPNVDPVQMYPVVPPQVASGEIMPLGLGSADDVGSAGVDSMVDRLDAGEHWPALG